MNRLVQDPIERGRWMHGGVTWPARLCLLGGFQMSVILQFQTSQVRWWREST